MIRLAVLFGLLSLPVWCDSAAEVLAVAESMASALAEDNPPAFEKSLSKELPGRDRLMTNVRAMLAEADAISSITVIESEGDDTARTLVLDWSLRLRQKSDGIQTQEIQSNERREPLTLKLVREGRKWRVVALSPMALFDPPDFR